MAALVIRTDTALARITLVSWADGSTDGLPVGCYLAYYDPNGNGGDGAAEWTDDPQDALTFPSQEAALEFLRTPSVVNPLRPDGGVNRPMTAFSLEIG